MHYCLSGIKTLTLKLQVPSKTWCEGQPFIRCLLCANENAEGFMCHSSVLLSTSSFNVEKKELQGYEQVLFCFQIFCKVATDCTGKHAESLDNCPRFK